MPKILRVRFDKTTLKEATAQVLEWANGSSKHYVTTPNPEFLLEAQKNPKFLKALNKSDLNIADGTGILWAAKYQKITENDHKKSKKMLKWIFSLVMIILNPGYIKKVLPERVTGTDLMQSICKEADKQGKKIYLLGAEKGVAEKAKAAIENRNPNIKIVGTYSGSPKKECEDKIIREINYSRPDILFVAFGAPKQEFWITRNIQHLKTVKVAMGIGGAFDFIAKYKKRAPGWMQKVGLEWVYRLIQQPTRLKRIYNATVRFPLAVLRQK